jgi:endoglucanase
MGGIDGRVLPGQAVTVHGREELNGTIALPPKHLLPSDLQRRAVPLEYLLVDVGLPPTEVEDIVRVGDLVSFAQPPIEMGEAILAGHSLDNRASVAALTCCLNILQGRAFEWDVWTAATVQEEETLGGAYTSAFELNPKLAVAIDVTHGVGPGTKDHMTVPFGKGPALGWGPNIHPALHEAFQTVAERFEIPHILEALPRHSGTDAFAMQVAAAGIPTMVISIPLRYMHTPVEMVVLKDITRTARLLAEFIVDLDEKFMEKLTWDIK